MTRDQLSEHPSPQRHKVGGLELAFALWGGPVAWYAQLNINYGLIATACFPNAQRNLVLPDHAAWTYVAAFVVYGVLLLVALAAGWMAVRLYRRTGGETAGSSADVEEAGTGRTRFLSYWGMLTGFGFALVILVNAAALIMVPPCTV